MKPKVLAIVPVKASLHPVLKQTGIALATAMIQSNPDLEMGLLWDNRSEPSLATDGVSTSRTSRIRAKIIDSLVPKQWDFLLWIDADIVYYPADLPTRLLKGNPTGMSAPMVFVEDYGGAWFYDSTAFVLKGKSHIRPDHRSGLEGRNVMCPPPYFPETPKEVVVEMDSVGTVTMVPTWVYDHAKYVEHIGFTEHFPIACAVRAAGHKVTAHRDVVVIHANLPKYGEAWH